MILTHRIVYHFNLTLTVTGRKIKEEITVFLAEGKV